MPTAVYSQGEGKNAMLKITAEKDIEVNSKREVSYTLISEIHLIFPHSFFFNLCRCNRLEIRNVEGQFLSDGNKVYRVQCNILTSHLHFFFQFSENQFQVTSIQIT